MLWGEMIGEFEFGRQGKSERRRRRRPYAVHFLPDRGRRDMEMTTSSHLLSLCAATRRYM